MNGNGEPAGRWTDLKEEISRSPGLKQRPFKSLWSHMLVTFFGGVHVCAPPRRHHAADPTRHVGGGPRRATATCPRSLWERHGCDIAGGLALKRRDG